MVIDKVKKSINQLKIFINSIKDDKVKQRNIMAFLMGLICLWISIEVIKINIEKNNEVVKKQRENIIQKDLTNIDDVKKMQNDYLKVDEGMVEQNLQVNKGDEKIQSVETKEIERDTNEKPIEEKEIESDKQEEKRIVKGKYINKDLGLSYIISKGLIGEENIKVINDLIKENDGKVIKEVELKDSYEIMKIKQENRNDMVIGIYLYPGIRDINNLDEEIKRISENYTKIQYAEGGPISMIYFYSIKDENTNEYDVTHSIIPFGKNLIVIKGISKKSTNYNMLGDIKNIIKTMIGGDLMWQKEDIESQ